MFDLPLLEARYRLNRERFPLLRAPHFDLLHPARRLWKARLESCRLQALEAQLIGLRAQADIPGEHIPQVYFDWVRRRDARALVKVFRHNRDDIVSLAALSILACQWVEDGRAEDPRDVLSLARVLERARLYERSDAQYRRALLERTGRRCATPPCAAWPRGPSAPATTRRPRACGRPPPRQGDVLAMHELAMHHEHREPRPGGGAPRGGSGPRPPRGERRAAGPPPGQRLLAPPEAAERKLGAGRQRPSAGRRQPPARASAPPPPGSPPAPG